MIKVDSRGMLCPMPIIATKKAIKENPNGESIEVILDNKIAVKNLSTYLKELSIEFNVNSEGDLWKVSFITKTIDDTIKAESFCSTEKSYVVAIKSDKMGLGSDELGDMLLRAYLNVLAESDKLPSTIVLYNSGALTAVNGSDTARSLMALEDRGVMIIICGACVDFFKIGDKISVGSISNMYKIASILSNADSVIYP